MQILLPETGTSFGMSLDSLTRAILMLRWYCQNIALWSNSSRSPLEDPSSCKLKTPVRNPLEAWFIRITKISSNCDIVIAEKIMKISSFLTFCTFGDFRRFVRTPLIGLNKTQYYLGPSREPSKLWTTGIKN